MKSTVSRRAFSRLQVDAGILVHYKYSIKSCPKLGTVGTLDLEASKTGAVRVGELHAAALVQVDRMGKSCTHTAWFLLLQSQDIRLAVWMTTRQVEGVKNRKNLLWWVPQGIGKGGACTTAWVWPAWDCCKAASGQALVERRKLEQTGAEQGRAEQGRAEHSMVEHSRSWQSTVEHGRT